MTKFENLDKEVNLDSDSLENDNIESEVKKQENIDSEEDIQDLDIENNL